MNVSKRNVQWTKSTLHLKQMNMILAMCHYDDHCMFQKWNVQWVALKFNALLPLKNIVRPTLNLSLNLTDSVNKSKCRIKINLLEPECHFSLLLQVFELFHDQWDSTLHITSNAVPGALPSKFTMSEIHNVMQMSECIEVITQYFIIHYDKSGLRW